MSLFSVTKGSKRTVPLLPQEATPGDLSLVLPYRHFLAILEMLKALDQVAPRATLYQIARRCCRARLDAMMPSQQQNPRMIGFPPDFTSFTMFVFKPIAAIARMIKNLLSSLNGVNTAAGTPKLVAIVVMIEANTK